MRKKLATSRVLSLLFLLLPIFIFFSPVWLRGKMPIPADTIVGMYHPFRDVVWKGFSAGVPFKNFLLTDAVRQQYPWRELAIELLKKGKLPLWNPYTHAGTPLLGNIQTALFNPLNYLMFFFPFNTAWTIQVILQPVLLAVFMFSYLVNIGVSRKASVLASLAITFSGFSIAWLEWNTTLYTLVWLPLALLAIEKLTQKESLTWYIILGLALASIVLAGFLQTAFYALALLGTYALYRLAKVKTRLDQKKKLFMRLGFVCLLVALVTSIQWLPTARLIANSARAIDQGDVLTRDDWFLPWQNLVQFIAPDFFGNPSTLNYWGIFNYMEFVGYIGIAPLAFALLGIFSKADEAGGRKRFFLVTLVFSLIFTTSNPVSKIPFLVKIPLVSTAQPTRLMMLADFSLAVLAAFGAESFLSDLYSKKIRFKPILAVLGSIGVALAGIWIFSLLAQSIWPSISPQNLLVTQRNLILPSALVFITSIAITTWMLIRGSFANKKAIIHNSLFLILFLLTSADLIRFAGKFTPFSDPDFLYPPTGSIEFLKKDNSPWRYMTTDRRILPPNFSVPYRLQTIEGYDPVYSARYGTLIASAQKGEPALEPIPFHRIIRPDNYQSPVFDVLNVKYVLALTDLFDPKLEKVYQEGETRVYRNNQAFPRAFLIPNYETPESETEALEQVFALKKEEVQVAEILEYEENQVRIGIDTETGGMLVLADTYYPGWKVTLDGIPIPIKRVLYTLRGTMIPSGSHEVFYRYSQL